MLTWLQKAWRGWRWQRELQRIEDEHRSAMSGVDRARCPACARLVGHETWCPRMESSEAIAAVTGVEHA